MSDPRGLLSLLAALLRLVLAVVIATFAAAVLTVLMEAFTPGASDASAIRHNAAGILAIVPIAAVLWWFLSVRGPLRIRSTEADPLTVLLADVSVLQHSLPSLVVLGLYAAFTVVAWIFLYLVVAFGAELLTGHRGSEASSFAMLSTLAGAIVGSWLLWRRAGRTSSLKATRPLRAPEASAPTRASEPEPQPKAPRDEAPEDEGPPLPLPGGRSYVDGASAVPFAADPDSTTPTVHVPEPASATTPPKPAVSDRAASVPTPSEQRPPAPPPSPSPRPPSPGSAAPGIPEPTLDALDRRQREALRLLAENGAVRITDLAAALDMRTARVGGFMNGLDRQLQSFDRRYFRTETLPSGESQFVFIPQRGDA